MSEAFQIKNLDSFERALAKSPIIAEKMIRLALEESMINWQREAGIKTPVDTGKLRWDVMKFSSVRIDKTRAILQPHNEYAVFVHEGTSRMRKRPFLKEGLDSAKNKIDRIFKKRGEKLMAIIAQKSNLGL